jgi:hypothetical protein
LIAIRPVMVACTHCHFGTNGATSWMRFRFRNHLRRWWDEFITIKSFVSFLKLPKQNVDDHILRIHVFDPHWSTLPPGVHGQILITPGPPFRPLIDHTIDFPLINQNFYGDLIASRFCSPSPVLCRTLFLSHIFVLPFFFIRLGFRQMFDPIWPSDMWWFRCLKSKGVFPPFKIVFGDPWKPIVSIPIRWMCRFSIFFFILLQLN